MYTLTATVTEYVGCWGVSFRMYDRTDDGHAHFLCESPERFVSVEPISHDPLAEALTSLYAITKSTIPPECRGLACLEQPDNHVR